MLNSIVDTEVKSILGRADVVIKTNTDVFVIELKVDDTIQNALAQIDDKGYSIPYESEISPNNIKNIRSITKCGVCISSKQRNISEWCITDAKGNIIEEKKF